MNLRCSDHLLPALYAMAHFPTGKRSKSDSFRVPGRTERLYTALFTVRLTDGLETSFDDLFSLACLEGWTPQTRVRGIAERRQGRGTSDRAWRTPSMIVTSATPRVVGRGGYRAERRRADSGATAAWLLATEHAGTRDEAEVPRWRRCRHRAL